MDKIKNKENLCIVSMSDKLYLPKDRNYWEELKNQDLTGEFILTCQRQLIGAHKFILASASKYFSVSS